MVPHVATYFAIHCRIKTLGSDMPGQRAIRGPLADSQCCTPASAASKIDVFENSLLAKEERIQHGYLEEDRMDINNLEKTIAYERKNFESFL